MKSHRILLGMLALVASLMPAPRALSAEGQSGVTIHWSREKASSANAAIMAYLGEPVAPPASLDPAYTPEGLTSAFRVLCSKIGCSVVSLAVNDAEFPFLVHGVISGADFHDLQSGLSSMPGYIYGGSVTGRTRSGTTYFSLNMTPRNLPSREQAETVRRRLMIRLQMAAAAWTE